LLARGFPPLLFLCAGAYQVDLK